MRYVMTLVWWTFAVLFYVGVARVDDYGFHQDLTRLLLVGCGMVCAMIGWSVLCEAVREARPPAHHKRRKLSPDARHALGSAALRDRYSRR